MRKLLFLPLVVLLVGVGCRNADQTEAAYAVLERTLGVRPQNVTFKQISKSAEGTHRYATEVRDGYLTVEGSGATALCRGFYDYMVSAGYGVINWSGSRIELPDSFPESTRKEVVAPFKDHLYYNVCTFGYTTAHWGWTEWEREIDWMALHGFDMPLAPIAGEAILARVWKKMGLTDEQIGEYFTGPAHMPWMRMGNMTELDGAPSAEWHQKQIELQHKIVDRMRLLGMKPVYQGFAGFVPKAMEEHYPEISLTETKWAGLKSYMLSPLDSLFSVIGTDFIREWEKEFGRGTYYLIDSFNELEIPFGEPGSQERSDGLRNYSEIVYKSLSDANPDAVWVMQGWMFGYNRNYWDQQSVEALLSGAPDGKLMVIDLAVDFNHYVWRSEKSWNYLDGFYGKDWVYSTVPNFGGRSALTGALDFYANGHVEALASPNKGRLTGYGTSPEGIEQNDVIYEIISAAGWSRDSIDVQKFLHDYSKARYGDCPPQIDRFWEEMLQSSYNTFTSHARFKWQMRPFLQRKQMMGINAHYYDAIESFLDCAPQMEGVETYRTDAVMYAAMYLSAKAENLLDAVNWAYVRGNSAAARRYEERFVEILTDADKLLQSHPLLRLDRWLKQARDAALSADEAQRFEREARRLVTIWGGPSLYDYSSRVWSGLIRDFYIPRWQKYFELKKSPQTFDFADHDQLWVDSEGLSDQQRYPKETVVETARALVAKYKDVSPEMIDAPDDAISFWSPFEFSNANPRIYTTIDREWLPYVKGLKITGVRGSDPVKVKRIVFTSSRSNRADLRTDITVRPGQTITIPVDLEVPELLPAEITVNVYLEGRAGTNSYGTIELLFTDDRPNEKRVSFK